MLIDFLKMQWEGRENLRPWKERLKAKLFGLQLDRDGCQGPQNKADANSSAGAGWELELSPGTLQVTDQLVSHIYYLMIQVFLILFF